ncbi:hypothetical protein BGX24_009523 [Mortierella sp. AD032]|nr:hypothetical protein BGX24_009523 [Mortierella sp. AD032]
MRTRLSERLLTIGCACLLAQGALGNLDPRDPVADILAGSLEYSWTGSDGEDSQFSLYTKPHSQSQQQQHQLWMEQIMPLEALESAFDRAGSGRQQFSTATITNDDKTQSSNNKTPTDCNGPRFIVEETWESTLVEIGRVLQAYKFLLPTLLPLSKVMTEPLEEEDKTEMPRLMRLLELGLVAFHYVAESIPQQTKSQMETVLLGTGLLQQHLIDLFKCQNRISSPEVTAKATSRRSCVAVGIFYEDYLEQLRRIVETANSRFRENQAVQDVVSLLKFQTEGVYLTQQGARKAIDALEASDSMDEMKDLVALMRLTLASGDALQACQSSVQKSVLKKEARAGSVSDLEQLIYGHLSMGGRRQDPTSSGGSSPMGSKEGSAARCHETYTGAVDMVETILSISVEQGDSGAILLHRVLTRDMDRIGEWIQEAWKSKDQQQTSLENGGGDSEWRRVELLLALLVKNLKDVELSSEKAESVAREFSRHSRQLEKKIHELDACILSVERQRNGPNAEAEADAEAGEGEGESKDKGTLLPCGFLAERGRETMMMAMGGATLAKLTGMGQGVEGALEEVARSAGLWDEAHECVFKKAVTSGQWDVKQIVDTRATLDGLERAYGDYMFAAAGDETKEGLSGLVPLVVLQIRTLQACANIQQATTSPPFSSASTST